MLRRKSLRQTAVLVLVALLGSISIGLKPTPAKAAPPSLEIDAKSAILIDYASGQVLFEQNADESIAPASLTKLMTLHLAYEKIASGDISRDDLVNVSKNAWAATMPGSSVMFLEPGDIVTVDEVMKGIAIPSGNDAAIAMAEHIAGSLDAFVNLMNQEAKDLGFTTLHFADPAGLDPKNQITAREFAQFCRIYIQKHPEALTELHSVTSFTYPQDKNIPEDRKGQIEPITQPNRNTLLGVVEGVDGLKTGFIDESGYNFAVTAKRGDMRLIGIILGVPGATEQEGSARRAEEATKMLEWGFQNFVSVTPEIPAIQPVRVWKGASSKVELVPAEPVQITVPRGMEDDLVGTVTQEQSVIGPVAEGQKLGELVYTADGEEVARFDLVAANEVKQGNFFKRLWDTIRLTVIGWFTRD